MSEFKRNLDPIKALNLGWDRILKKGNKFILVVPEMSNQPEREEVVVAIEDETSYKHRYIEKTGRYGESDEVDYIEIRQVKWEIPEVASGYAYMTENCEHPQWTFTTNPRLY